MDNYMEMHKSICRVCLSYTSYRDMVRLFDTSSVDGLSYYGKAVVSFANIKLESNHNLPTMMCKNCLLLLKQAIMFKHKCKNSDLQLKKLLSINNSSNDCKEIICEYAIFKHNFPEECIPTAPRNTSKVNRETTFTFNKKTDGICLQKQKKAESKSHHSHDSNDNITSNYYQNSLDSIPDTCDIDSERKYSKIEKDSTDALFDKLEKMIFTGLDMDSTIYNPRNRTKRKLVRKNDFKCTICDKQLTSRLSYNRHMQSHNGYRFMCESCAKAFPTVAELNVHQVAAHGIGPHLKCNYCPFKAARKITLIEHIRLHTGERPYTCEKCGLTFRRKAIYRNHLKCHGEKNVQCPHCPKLFYRHCSMLAHMNNIHERLYVYACNKCGVTYTKNMTVRRHLAEKHGIPREMQGKIEKIRKAIE